MKKGEKNHNIKNWMIILLSVIVLIISVLYIFKRPIIYYTRLAYSKIVEQPKLAAVPYSNKETNLYKDVEVPEAEVYGIDISRHQGKINWKRLKDFRFKYNKIDFIYIKATESSSWVDKTFDVNWRKAKKHDFIRGAYHFFDPKIGAKEQINNFISKVKLEKGDLPPMLDVEQESSITTSKYRAKVKECLILLEKHYGVKPILYVNQFFYEQYFNTSEFAEYSLWLSSLTNSPPKLSNWVIWQFSHTSIVPGIDEYVDFNIFNGSINKLKILQKK